MLDSITQAGLGMAHLSMLSFTGSVSVRGCQKPGRRKALLALLLKPMPARSPPSSTKLMTSCTSSSGREPACSRLWGQNVTLGSWQGGYPHQWTCCQGLGLWGACLQEAACSTYCVIRLTACATQPGRCKFMTIGPCPSLHLIWKCREDTSCGRRGQGTRLQFWHVVWAVCAC